MMDKHGIKSLDQLSSEEKKRFFNAVDKNYKAKNEETLNENPAVIATAARMAIQNKQGNKVSVNTARQSSYSKKDPQAHKKAKSLFQKIKDKISKKEKKKSEPKKQSKSSAQKYADLYGGGAKVESVDEAMSSRVKKAIMIAVQMGGDMTGAVKKIEKIKKGLSKDKKVMQALRLANENIAPNHDGKAAPYGSGYEEMDEAKIQVQGIGMYDDKTLKKKIIKLASELQKNAKSGNWNKASENGIRALGRMWGAYQDYAMNNESVNEDVFAIVDKYNDKKQDYDQVYFKDNNLNKVKKHMKKMGSKYGKMNLIKVKPNGKMSLVEDVDTIKRINRDLERFRKRRDDIMANKKDKMRLSKAKQVQNKIDGLELKKKKEREKNEDLDIGHEDNEPDMLKKTSLEIMEYGKKLYDKLDYYDDMNNEVDFPTWWQAKLIISKEYLQKAYHYLDSEEKTDES